MSQIDADENLLSETLAEQGIINNNLKLVPVAESIRYRKRAQSAEKENEILAEQLAQAKTKNSAMAEQLNNVKMEQKLIQKLVAAGAVDIETAVLIAKARTEDDTKADLDDVIEQMKKEKQYLFGGEPNAALTFRRTAGVKDRMQTGHVILGRAAKKAAVTGNRTDLQEYLKLRRSFL